MSEPGVVTETPITASVAEVLAELDEYRSLEADWDLEGAEPIDPESHRLARTIVEAVASRSGPAEVPWQRHDTAPGPDGSVMLTWEGNDRHVLMIARPGEPDIVECILQMDLVQIAEVLSDEECVA
jgi:hypothetical protein